MSEIKSEWMTAKDAAELRGITPRCIQSYAIMGK